MNTNGLLNKWLSLDPALGVNVLNLVTLYDFDIELECFAKQNLKLNRCFGFDQIRNVSQLKGNNLAAVFMNCWNLSTFFIQQQKMSLPIVFKFFLWGFQNVVGHFCTNGLLKVTTFVRFSNYYSNIPCGVVVFKFHYNRDSYNLICLP